MRKRAKAWRGSRRTTQRLVLCALLFGWATTAVADDNLLIWQRMFPYQFATFQTYAHLMIATDADHPGSSLALWALRKLPLTEYMVNIGSPDSDPSGVSGGLVWVELELAAGEGNQLDGQSAMDFDYQIRMAPTPLQIDAAIASLEVYVSDQPLPDIAKTPVLHEEGLLRQVAHRGYGCQMARWLRGNEIVKAVGFVSAGADQPTADQWLTVRGLNALCASRIVAFGLGLNFIPAGVNPGAEESVMLSWDPIDIVELNPNTDQPLLELLYRSDLKPGVPRRDVLKLIDGLKPN